MAGKFYPAEPELLRQTLEDLLETAQPVAAPGSIKALILPHAAYQYSGKIAAVGYRLMVARLPAAPDFRVAILGPAHFVLTEKIVAPTAEAFLTPLGSVPVDREFLAGLLSIPALELDDEAHREEHAIEVHLPFLQVVLERFSLVPLVVGECALESAAALVEAFWERGNALVIASSDLSHYLPYEDAQRTDAETARFIESLDAKRLTPKRACGYMPIAAVLEAARRAGYRIMRLALQNSGDVSGLKDWVVGYGAWVIYELEPA